MWKLITSYGPLWCLLLLSVYCKDVNWVSQHPSCWYCIHFTDGGKSFWRGRKQPNSFKSYQCSYSWPKSQQQSSLFRSAYLSVGFLDHQKVFEPTYLRDMSLSLGLGQPWGKAFSAFLPKRSYSTSMRWEHVANQAPSWPGGRIVEGLGFQWSGWFQIVSVSHYDNCREGI